MEETRPGDQGTNKREESDGLGLGFGFGSTYDHHQPQKLVRTDAFSSSSSSSKKAAAAAAAASTISTAVSSPASPHLHPLHLATMSMSGGDISGGHGPTFLYSGGGIYDPYDATARALQPYGNPFKSQVAGMGGAAALGYPFFTPAQWQELKRQALIYKHIVNSAPIPSDLLMESRHIIPNLPPLYPNAVQRGSGCLNFNLRFSNNTDPEPGRCRRTDGKKWRCSRDVAPDMKYCERHMHRGRPRSRKPVEHRNNKAAAAAEATSAAATTASASVATNSSATPNSAVTPPLLQSKPHSSDSTSSGMLPKSHLMLPLLSMVPEKDPRYLDWMKAGMQQMSNKIDGFGTASGFRPYEESYADLNDPCHAFLNHDLSSLEEGPPLENRYPPRRFIDAWSSESVTTTTNPASLSPSPVSGSGKLSPSTLTLSMCGGGVESQDSIDMGLGINDSVKSHPLSWMNSATPLGGPLAEVLQSSTTAAAAPHIGGSYAAGLINLMSKGCYGNEEIGGKDSPPSFLSASSPTGVLQRTFVSPSDSGGNSSPTFQSGSRSEMGLRWMSHIK